MLKYCEFSWTLKTFLTRSAIWWKFGWSVLLQAFEIGYILHHCHLIAISITILIFVDGHTTPGFHFNFSPKSNLLRRERESLTAKLAHFPSKKSVMIIDFWVLSDQLVDGPKNGAWTTDRIAPRRTWRIVKYLRWICRSHHYTGETNEGTRQHRNDHFSYIIPRRGRSTIRVIFTKFFCLFLEKLTMEKVGCFV